MSTVSAVIPASAFLRRRTGGLTGVARCVILADLAGADEIMVIGEGPVERDWQTSFATRGRALPRVVVVPGIDAVPPPHAGDRRMTFPADELPTAAGVARLRDAPGMPLEPGVHRYVGETPAALTHAILTATLKPTEGWVGRNINRPISFRMAAIAMRLGIGPTPVTWFTLALAMVMTMVLAHGGAGWLALGGVLYQAVSVIDCVDGDIARSTFRFSKFGALLDTSCDMVANFGFVIGLLTGLVRTYGPAAGVQAGAIVALLAFGILLMSVLLRMGPRRGSFDVLRAALERRLDGRPRLQAVTLTLERMFKRDFYVLLACVVCLSGLAWTLPPVILGGLAIWIGAIIWCAPLIVADKGGELLPAHLRAG